MPVYRLGVIVKPDLVHAVHEEHGVSPPEADAGHCPMVFLPEGDVCCDPDEPDDNVGGIGFDDRYPGVREALGRGAVGMLTCVGAEVVPCVDDASLRDVWLVFDACRQLEEFLRNLPGAGSTVGQLRYRLLLASRVAAKVSAIASRAMAGPLGRALSKPLAVCEGVLCEVSPSGCMYLVVACPVPDAALCA